MEHTSSTYSKARTHVPRRQLDNRTSADHHEDAHTQYTILCYPISLSPHPEASVERCTPSSTYREACATHATVTQFLSIRQSPDDVPITSHPLWVTLHRDHLPECTARHTHAYHIFQSHLNPASPAARFSARSAHADSIFEHPRIALTTH